jgi:hypothetical protein
MSGRLDPPQSSHGNPAYHRLYELPQLSYLHVGAHRRFFYRYVEQVHQEVLFIKPVKLSPAELPKLLMTKKYGKLLSAMA